MSGRSWRRGRRTFLQRHGCGVYAAFVDDFTEYGGGDSVYKTTYQLYHANELGMGENRDVLSSC